MAQLGGRRQEDQASNALGGSGQSLFLESCSSCGVPLTIIAAAAPQNPLCDDCAKAAEATEA
jgi:hypothetical protein